MAIHLLKPMIEVAMIAALRLGGIGRRRVLPQHPQHVG
jgi:hypothetical protein